MNFFTGVLPGIGLGIIAIVAIAVALVVGHRTQPRRGLMVGAVGAMVIVGLFLVSLIDTPESVWVNGGADDYSNVSFEAPRARGYAAGDEFGFMSKATKDQVFAAFSEAYPDAKREGDESMLILDGHAYVLAYLPEAEYFTYLLYNERALPEG